MKLEGIHHITAITEDGQRNVDFYAGVLGLRLVKKTVNQDNPTVYHLFYADEKGSAGADGKGGIAPERGGETPRFAAPGGLGHNLAVVGVPDDPLIADHPEVPAE